MPFEERKEEIIARYYENCEDDPGFYRCQRCGQKVYAGEVRSDDLLKHEMEKH
jgi:hypothetical protein